MRHYPLLLLALLASCTVYAPMQPTLPLLTERGQADFGASIQPNGRLEATAAYSPWERVVVLGGLTGLPRLGEHNFLATAQYEVGAGGYQLLGNWLLGAQLGYGQAYSHRGFEQVLGGYREYEASYQKQFVQAGVAYQGILRGVSLTYRLTQVQFSYLTDAQYGPVPLGHMLRHELAVGSRAALFGSERWQLAGTGGFSLAADPYDNTVGSPPGTGRASNVLTPALFMSLGVVYRLGTYW